MSSFRVLVVAAAAMLAMVIPGSVLGQAAQRKKTTSKATPKKILRLEEMKVEGRIQKPQAMFLMPRANLSYDLERSEPLLPKVVGVVDKEPF